MTAELAAPAATASPAAHADWLELRALASADRNSAFEELASAIRLSGTTDAVAGVESAEDEVDPRRERLEPLASRAFDELDDRATACGGRGGNYPFEVEPQYLEARRYWKRSTYVFLLLLSTYGKDAGPSDSDGARLFEDVCGVAVHSI
jgi:hypothetical protein